MAVRRGSSVSFLCDDLDEPGLSVEGEGKEATIFNFGTYLRFAVNKILLWYKIIFIRLASSVV